MTRQQLYDTVQNIRLMLNLGFSHYPICSKQLCSQLGVVVEEIEMKTPGLRGMAHKKDKNKKNDIDLIALKLGQSDGEQNFYCGHELMHLLIHCGIGAKTFGCYEKALPNQNSFVEWQANEGAAEFLVPYRIFIPLYVEKEREHAHENDWDYNICDDLARHFRVTPAVIENRIKSLSYNIQYYIKKETLDGSQVYSDRELNKAGWKVSPQKTFCLSCRSRVTDSQEFCHICGIHLKQSYFPDFKLTKKKGVGYMKYKKIELDKHGRTTICPHCKNEEPFEEGAYCIICGVPRQNRCMGEWIEEYNKADWDGPCKDSVGHILPGNARHCPFCGHQTAFNVAKVLCEWKEECPPNNAISLPITEQASGDFFVIDDSEESNLPF